MPRNIDKMIMQQELCGGEVCCRNVNSRLCIGEHLTRIGWGVVKDTPPDKVDFLKYFKLRGIKKNTDKI